MKLNLLANANEQSTSMISDLIKIINQLLLKQDNVIIAVSGGRSPIALFEKLSHATIDWNKIIITLVDERMTPTSSDDSNENLVRKYLLRNNTRLARFIGLMQENISINDMTNAANKNVKKIDIAILGMGEDGHTASIFPDCNELRHALDLTQKPSYIETNSISAKYQRIGLNLSALINIPHLLLAISGQTKLKVLQAAIQQQSVEYPISYLIKHRPDVIAYWFE